MTRYKRSDNILSIIANVFDIELFRIINSSSSRQTIMDLLSTLTEREQFILIHRHVHSMTQKQIGELLRVGRGRISQIEDKGYRKLRHPSRSRKLKAFLDT